MSKNKLTPDQIKIKNLLKLDISIPVVLLKGTDRERTVWRLPNGVVSRKNGPAVIWTHGDHAWYKNGKKHREDGPAHFYVTNLQRNEWYKNGVLHREEGPAIKWSNGDEEWFKNGNLHREDGPAYIVYINGKKSIKDEDYYINGKYISRVNFKYKKLVKGDRALKVQKLKNIINYLFKIF